MSHIHRHSHPRGVPSEVTFDAWLVVVGLLLAYVLARTDVVQYLASITADFTFVSSFIVGTFFTSVLTTTASIVAIVEFAHYGVSPFVLALVGGAGAVVGDLLIFRFVRSPLAHYFVQLAFHSNLRKAGAWLDQSIFWWVVPALGALVIASPLPDELGLLMMGLSHIRVPQFIVLSYIMNAIGIFLIATAGQGMF